MDIEIRYKSSAFDHGVTEADIEWAFNTAIHDCLMEPFTNRYVLTGFNTHGILIEVMYNDIGENRVNVFHAMKCRDPLLELLEQGETYG
ncbi:MAG: hypothetical protein LBR23_10220 [Spirochaetaceae bacterium]|jgi:hypothetical protein|nr:hypothetical protein [Spirochaetaceae bacterium]